MGLHVSKSQQVQKEVTLGERGGVAVVGVLAQTLGFPFVVSGEGGLLS